MMTNGKIRYRKGEGAGAMFNGDFYATTLSSLV